VLPEDKTPDGLTTVLLPMQVGDIWRVQIVWPNGSVHYFGSFAAEKAVADWIAAHPWLRAQPETPNDASG
jgi:hypothetical protein